MQRSLKLALLLLSVCCALVYCSLVLRVGATQELLLPLKQGSPFQASAGTSPTRPTLSEDRYNELHGLLAVQADVNEFTLGYCLHLLQLFGPEARAFKAGKAVKLLDEILLQPDVNRVVEPDVLEVTEFGLRFCGIGAPGEAHRNQSIAVLALLGVPLDGSVSARGHHARVRDIVSDSLSTFDIRNGDASWALIAYSMYLTGNPMWTNALGDRCSMEVIVNELISLPWERESCAGAHRLVALTCYLRGLRSARLLCSKETERRLVACLRNSFLAVAAAQASDGSIRSDWYVTVRTLEPERLDHGDTELTFEATAHLAEWLGHLSPEIQDDRIYFSRAVNYLKHTVLPVDVKQVRNKICPTTHAFLAIASEDAFH